MITINKQLDMTPGAIPVVIHRSQYDSDFSIVFTLFARTGDFTIASGTTAKVRGTKKSGTGYSADATIDVSAKTVTVTGDQQMTVASGQNIFEIVLLSGTSELCSANFILDVERAALDMDTITDDTVIKELDNLDQFIKEAEAAADRAEDAAATFSVDATLTVSGKAADAKIVGDAIASEDKKALAAFATDTASGAVANFPDGADSIPMKDVLVHIDPVQEGSGDPSPDNVRPITGWTGAKVTRTGKNLLPSYAIGQQKTQNGITGTANADGSITYVGTSTGAFWGLGDSPSILVKAGTYILSARNNTDIAINIVNADTGTFIEGIIGNNSKTITFSNDTKIYYYTKIESGKTVDTTATYQLELGSTATDYEPYSGQTYDITFPSEAGTIYGGTLDVTNGVLTVDRAIIASYAGETLPTTWISDRDVYSEGATPTTGAQVCYKLATPITYQLTPQEITSLLGTNNLWADTGDSDVEYRADTKVYVDAKVAATESNITDLQNNKVDMTTPLLNFDDTATDPLTDDGALANALRNLEILDDVIPSGGGTLYLKKVLTKVNERLKATTVTYKDYSTTTGTSLYQGYYFGNVEGVAISGKTLIGVTVFSVQDNVPAFCSMLSNNIIRAYSTVASKSITIRCIYQG